MSLVWVVAGAAGAAVVCGLGYMLGTAGRTYWRSRGERVVNCPETRAPAGVRVAALRAAWAALRRQPQLQLETCTRWPERAGCGQECLEQIEDAADGCLVRNMLTHWYAGKTCVLCGRELGVIDWHTHKPALMNAERRTFEWGEIQAVRLPEVLRTHMPVCWDCHIIARLCQDHPERVVFRH